jgi:hypothetical protein
MLTKWSGPELPEFCALWANPLLSFVERKSDGTCTAVECKNWSLSRSEAVARLPGSTTSILLINALLCEERCSGKSNYPKAIFL